MRERFWYWLLEAIKFPRAQILPMWLKVIRAALFPIRALVFRTQDHHGYHWMRDGWTIEGVFFSRAVLHHLATLPPGTLLRIVKREWGTVITQQVTSDEIFEEAFEEMKP